MTFLNTKSKLELANTKAQFEREMKMLATATIVKTEFKMSIELSIVSTSLFSFSKVPLMSSKKTFSSKLEKWLSIIFVFSNYSISACLKNFGRVRDVFRYYEAKY